MRLGWDRDPRGGWLQFRSATFYDDRVKEVPTRLFTRSSASRRLHGALTLGSTGLADSTTRNSTSESMAEGARECFGLKEWDLARGRYRRPHMQAFLAEFTPAQRKELADPTGMPFTRMTLAQQQKFLRFALPPDAEGLASLEDLSGAGLPRGLRASSWSEWAPYGSPWLRWGMPVSPGKRAFRPPVRERTREAALAASRPLLARIARLPAHRGMPSRSSAFPSSPARPRAGSWARTWCWRSSPCRRVAPAPDARDLRRRHRLEHRHAARDPARRPPAPRVAFACPAVARSPSRAVAGGAAGSVLSPMILASLVAGTMACPGWLPGFFSSVLQPARGGGAGDAGEGAPAPGGYGLA